MKGWGSKILVNNTKKKTFFRSFFSGYIWILLHNLRGSKEVENVPLAHWSPVVKKARMCDMYHGQFCSFLLSTVTDPPGTHLPQAIHRQSSGSSTCITINIYNKAYVCYRKECLTHFDCHLKNQFKFCISPECYEEFICYQRVTIQLHMTQTTVQKIPGKHNVWVTTKLAVSWVKGEMNIINSPIYKYRNYFLLLQIEGKRHCMYR